MREFVLDVSRPYLSKYTEIVDYHDILEAQQYIKEIAIIMAEHNLNQEKTVGSNPAHSGNLIYWFLLVTKTKNLAH